MIGSLRGRVAGLGAGTAVVEVGGVGYRVTLTPGDLGRVRVGEEAYLHIHTHVREDALVLYGFSDKESLAAFEALLGARGVGPSMALGIVSVLSAAELEKAVANSDAGALTAVPGVGAKTAARLLLELESRFPLDLGPGTYVATAPSGPGREVAEVREALAGLGYQPEEIRAALSRLPVSDSVAEMVRAALRELSRGG